MNLNSTYLGFELSSPLMVGASPIDMDLDAVKRCEDAGASAIVMHSLFEEQLKQESIATSNAIDEPAESFAEATSYFVEPPDFRLGPEEYLQQVAKVKNSVGIPVIGSLNGVTQGGWVKYAKMIQDAGADALELNVYDLPTDPDVDGATIEQRRVELVKQIKQDVSIPLAVKLSPFYTSLPNLSNRLADAGAEALVLFNRFYQPDIDLENLEVVRLHLSDSSELLLRLHWLAILSAKWNKVSLAVTGGVHTGVDALKAVMAGADGVQVVSAVLRNGPEQLTRIREQMTEWMEEHEYDSIRQMQGSMNMDRCPDPQAYQRVNYIRLLSSYNGV